jgi:hypothetical protein
MFRRILYVSNSTLFSTYDYQREVVALPRLPAHDGIDNVIAKFRHGRGVQALDLRA